MSLYGFLGDTHLGGSYGLGRPDASAYVNSRLVDYETTLLSTIEDFADAGCNQICLTGDIFEHRSPTMVQQKVFSRALHHATACGISGIHIVVGNHDQARLSSTTSLSYLKELNLPNIHIYDETTIVQLEENGSVVANLLFVPYRDRKFFNTESYNEAIDQVQKSIQFQLTRIENKAPRIAVVHQAVEGMLIGSEEEDLEFYGENQLFLPKSTFDQVDLTILGHIHKPGIVSANPYISCIGSMEKRGGFEDHDKIYALVDTKLLAADRTNPAQAIQYRKEPCREIYDLKLDYSHLTLGDLFQARIQKDIDLFMKTKTPKGSIIKTSLKICSADEKYVQPKQLYRYLKEKWEVHHCVEIRPEIFSARQARNDRITEQVSDTEALRLYLETAIDDQELKTEVLSAGIEIVKQVEAQIAAH